MGAKPVGGLVGNKTKDRTPVVGRSRDGFKSEKEPQDAKKERAKRVGAATKEGGVREHEGIFAENR